MIRTLVVVAVGLLLAVGALWLFQRRLIYLPAAAVGAPPAGWQEVAFATSDDVRLAGWFWPPESGAPIVIVFNGNAGNRADRLGLGSKLAAEGLGVALFDYRGYGGNAGSPSEDGLAADATAAAAWVGEYHPDHLVVYFGESLGVAVAIRLATERPPAALVLRSPFSSLAGVAAVHYPFLPVRLLLWDEYCSSDRIGHVTVPVTVIAGSADSIVPLEQSRAIHDAAPGPRSWLVIEGADHNDAELVQGDRVVAAVLDVLK